MGKKRKEYTDSQIAKIAERVPDGYQDLFMRPAIRQGIPCVELAIPQAVVKDLGGKLMPTVTIDGVTLALLIVKMVDCVKRAAKECK